MKPVSLSYIVPVFNEEPVIRGTLRQFVCELEELRDVVEDYEILVVDDGSTDATPRIVEEETAAAPRIRLIRHEANGGVGQAIRTGIRHAGKEWLSVNCADQPFLTSDIRRLVPLMQEHDLVVVCRNDRSANHWYRKLTSWGNYLLLRLLFPSRIGDFQFTQFYRTKFLAGMNLVSRGSVLPPEMILRCQRRGARIAQIRLPFHPRRAGEAKYGHPKHIAIALWEMARLRFLFWKESLAS